VVALAAATIPAVASRSGSGIQTWDEDLPTSGAQRVNLASAGKSPHITDRALRLGAEVGPSGSRVTAEHKLRVPADSVSASVTAHIPPGSEVAVEVRGRTDAAHWSGWHEIGTAAVVLGTPVSTVQFRLDLTGEATVSRLSVTARLDGRGGVKPAVSAQELVYRVFATREGPVGGRTANGHVIAPRDHFVALPSRRGLNVSAGARDYQVQVCYARTGRCELAPVWDVGPRNIKDDYWNWDGLRMTDNEWVPVAFQWT